jgi:hypothetical protein
LAFKEIEQDGFVTPPASPGQKREVATSVQLGYAWR